MSTSLTIHVRQLQIHKHHFYIRSELRNLSNFIDDFGIGPLSQSIYRQLVVEGRIWEFRDVFCAALALFGPDATWHKLFGKGCRQPDCLDHLIEDWYLSRSDESSQMAILDVLNTLVEYFIEPVSEHFPKVEWCLSLATKVAGDMQTLNSDTADSRPYHRWVYNREQHRRKVTVGILPNGRPSKDSNFRYLNDFAGVTLSTAAIPIYLPVGAENPGWIVANWTEVDNEALIIAMNASRKNGDYRTEAKCLGELICR